MRAKKIIHPRIQQQFGFGLLTVLSILTILPIVVVIIYIIIQGAPAISLDFITQMPSNGMRSGGILPGDHRDFLPDDWYRDIFSPIGGRGGNLSGRIRPG